LNQNKSYFNTKSVVNESYTFSPISIILKFRPFSEGFIQHCLLGTLGRQKQLFPLISRAYERVQLVHCSGAQQLQRGPRMKKHLSVYY